MTGNRQPLRSDSFDDESIGLLVRDVAEGWTMPPTRLDAPGWRDRVRTPGARRAAAVGGWLNRFGRAGSAAVALTVVGAFLAVLITRPSPGPGKSPGATDATPGASQPAFSPLPTLMVDGELPDPASVIVLADPGEHRVVDLSKGILGGATPGARFGSVFRLESDGTMLCLCLSEATWVENWPTVATISLTRYDADGTQISTSPIETWTGVPDPRDEGTYVPEQPPHVLTAASFSADGRYGFVGFSDRSLRTWKSGMLVVDLDDGSIIDRLSLPDSGTGDGDGRRVTQAPRVVGTLGQGELLISRPWYSWAPVTSQNAVYTSDNDIFRTTFAAGALADATYLPAAAGCGDQVIRGGPTAGGGIWLACSTGGSSRSTVRRLDAADEFLGDTHVTGQGGIEGDMSALSPDGRYVFVWNPASATLARIDVANGDLATGPAVTSTTGGEAGPLAAFGQWLAPAAAAKSFLQGAIVVSPDGAKVYAIGVLGVAAEREPTGSSGVFVFDAASLDLIDQWAPTADYVSLALSANGRYVYAAGMPGVDPNGARNSRVAASITVFDAATGNQRLIAGQLGRNLLLFESTILP